MADIQSGSAYKAASKPPFDCIALLLQGGGALGAYQGGVYQALAEQNLHPDWAVGISIGAINAAIIAGNPPEKRVERLHEFWEYITTDYWREQFCGSAVRTTQSDLSRKFINNLSAGSTLIKGVADFFVPRSPMPWLQKAGTLDATSYYNTQKFKATLERFVDFGLINANKMRLSVSAVNVRSGNYIYFDTTTHVIGPLHIMASGAMPPGFPAVEIDGEYYWDGGLVSNTPLQWVVDSKPHQDLLAFQVDLWSADGSFPRDMAEVQTRQKEIQFSSRTRANTDRFKNAHRLHHAFASLFEQLPDALKELPEAKLLSSAIDRSVYNIVHMIYHTQSYESDSKDYEFSRLSMDNHWKHGYRDALNTLSHPEVLERPVNPEGIGIFDFSSGKKSKIENALHEAAE